MVSRRFSVFQIMSPNSKYALLASLLSGEASSGIDSHRFGFLRSRAPRSAGIPPSFPMQDHMDACFYVALTIPCDDGIMLMQGRMCE